MVGMEVGEQVHPDRPPDDLLAVGPGLPPQGVDGSMDGRVLSYLCRRSFAIERLLNLPDELVRHLGIIR